MQSATNLDIKALLTLLLLKSGTSSKEIQTAVNVAAAARLMAAEEYAAAVQLGATAERGDGKISRIYVAPNGDTRFDPQVDGVNSDIKAMLTLLLLQNGASSKEIQTTLRLAASSHDPAAERQAEPDSAAPAATGRTAAVHAMTPKQAYRNDHLATAPVREFAA
jgi:hypothetical protein